MKIRKGFLILLAFVIPVFTACDGNRYRVNISGIKADIRIKRLEKDLFSMDPVDFKDNIIKLKEEYGKFLQLFSYVINIGEVSDSSWSNGLFSFATDKLNYEVYQNTLSVFPDLTWLENGMTKAFRHYLYYFPEKPVPEIYTCITGFNNSIITLKDSVLAIGLDRYLGSESKYYPMLQIYSYQADRMEPDHILPDAMYGWASSEWDFSEMDYDPENVLSEMIHEGKLMYFVKCMLPEEKDENIFGFSEAQMNFCRNNEDQMWQYLIENSLLFKTDQLTRRKLTGDAPFTSYFTNESPGRAAVWIGFRIIESFMRNNSNIRLADIMQVTDVQMILEKARYVPK